MSTDGSFVDNVEALLKTTAMLRASVRQFVTHMRRIEDWETRKQFTKDTRDALVEEARQRMRRERRAMDAYSETAAKLSRAIAQQCEQIRSVGAPSIVEPE